jgi:hypothetical protein
MTGTADREGHDRCGARTRSGGRCGLPAGWGTGHPGAGACKLHAGATPNHQARARRVLAERAVQTYGLPVDTTPERALLDEVARTAGHVLWLAARVAELEPAELVTTEYGPGVNVWLHLYRAERRHLGEVARGAITSCAADSAAASAAVLGQRMAGVLERAPAGLERAQQDEILARFTDELGHPYNGDGP